MEERRSISPLTFRGRRHRGRRHRSRRHLAAGTAAAGTAAAIKVAPLGAYPFVLGPCRKNKHDVEVRIETRIVENQALITNSLS